jgi:hypothetical protein
VNWSVVGIVAVSNSQPHSVLVVGISSPFSTVAVCKEYVKAEQRAVSKSEIKRQSHLVADQKDTEGAMKTSNKPLSLLYSCLFPSPIIVMDRATLHGSLACLLCPECSATYLYCLNSVNLKPSLVNRESYYSHTLE